MDLASGLPLESPAVVIPWGIAEGDLHSLLPQARRLTDDALAADVVWLGGWPQTLRFFFSPAGGGKLSSVEAGGASTGPLDELDGAFQSWQARLVSAFGPPTRTSAGPFDDRYPESAWEVPGATVRHWVIDGHATDHALSIKPR